MGFWDKTFEIAEQIGEVAKNVVTLGGYSAIQDSIAAYENKLTEHRSSVRGFEDANNGFRTSVEVLGNETADAVAILKTTQDFVRRLSYEEVSSTLPCIPGFRSPDLSDVNRIITEFNSAVEAGKGAGLGFAASTGAWVLVAHLGTASTGAAISGLAGAAAHSAILAWFGGGALAAGGGGMALGGLAIGGLVALPLLGYSAYKSYKESSRIDSEREKVESSALENERNVVKLVELAGTVKALQGEVVALKTEFSVELQRHRAKALVIAQEAATQQMALPKPWFRAQKQRAHLRNAARKAAKSV